MSSQGILHGALRSKPNVTVRKPNNFPLRRHDDGCAEVNTRKTDIEKEEKNG